uniref:Upstream stimulatory factor 1 n=1 Tax=Pundamilia nyererei TaxID=303518 RepID=A0A3B4GKD7_9CICH
MDCDYPQRHPPLWPTPVGDRAGDRTGNFLMCALIQFHRSLYGCATVYVSHCGYFSVIFTVFTVQAVFSQSEALEGDGSAETQYTYYPATIADATTGTMVTTVQASDTLLGQTTPTAAQYLCCYVFSRKQDAPRASRDEKRRAQHNEVERRRRDKINNWIVQLSKAIPDCNVDYTKTGQSKGGILSKACEYIKELRQSNLKLGEDVGVLDRLRVDNQLLRQEVEDWKSKNQILRNLLRQHGIVGSSSTEPQ